MATATSRLYPREPIAGRAPKISGLLAGIRRDHPLGLLWFDVAQHSGLYHRDWRLEGHRRRWRRSGGAWHP